MENICLTYLVPPFFPISPSPCSPKIPSFTSLPYFPPLHPPPSFFLHTSLHFSPPPPFFPDLFCFDFQKTNQRYYGYFSCRCGKKWESGNVWAQRPFLYPLFSSILLPSPPLLSLFFPPSLPHPLLIIIYSKIDCNYILSARLQAMLICSTSMERKVINILSFFISSYPRSLPPSFLPSLPFRFLPCLLNPPLPCPLIFMMYLKYMAMGCKGDATNVASDF